MGKEKKEGWRRERVFVKVARPTGPGGANERWAACEVCPTLNVFDNAGDVRAVVLIVGRRRAVKVKRSYGINTQNRSMYPCTLERSQTVAVCHQVATIVFGIKCNQSEKSQKPWSKDIAQCLSASCHDASVVMLRKKGLSE